MKSSKSKVILIFCTVLLVLAIIGVVVAKALTRDKTYTVYFHVGQAVIEREVKEGTKVSPPTDITLAEGEEADKWYADKEFTKEFSFDTKIDKNTHIYLKVKLRSITITFSANEPEGTTVSDFDFAISPTVLYGDVFVVPSTTPTISDENFVFSGWSYNGATYLPNESVEIKNAGNNAQFTAIWTNIDISNRRLVTFNMSEAANGYGEIITATANTYAAGQSVVVPNYQLRHSDNAKVFVGFTIDGDDTNTIYKPGDVITENISESINLTIVWQDSENVLVLMVNGSEQYRYVYITGHEFTLPTVENTNQYNFMGWLDTNNNLYQGGQTYVMPEGNNTLTAKIEPASQIIHFDANGADNVVQDVNKRYGETFTLPTIDREFYDFVGWSLNQNATSQDECLTNEGTAMLDLDATEATLFAIWAPKAYQVSYESNDSVVRTDNIGYGTSIVTPTDIIKPHYTLLGWNVNGDEMLFEGDSNTINFTLDTQTFTKDEIEAGITLTAIWQVNKVTITYNLAPTDGVVAELVDINLLPAEYTYNADNHTITIATYSYGTIYTIPTFVLKLSSRLSDQEFNGWNIGNAGEQITLNSDNVSSDDQVVAQMLVKTTDNTLYLYNEDTVIGEIKKVGGTEISLPSPSSENVPEGYKFKYWVVDPENEVSRKYNAGETYTFTTGTQKLYAVYVAIYNIALEKNNIEITQNLETTNITCEHNEDITLPVFNDTDKYQFIGWSTNSSALPTDASVIKKNATVKANFDTYSVTLYAVWQRKTTIIKFHPNYDSQTINEEYNLTVNTYDKYTGNFSSVVYTRTNYVISSWNTKSDGNGTSYSPSANVQIDVQSTEIVLYAIWANAPKQIIYAKNDGTSGEQAQQIVDTEYSATVQIIDNTFTNNGYRFVSWNTNPDGTGVEYTVGSNFVVNFDEESITLYAIWFNLNRTINSASDLTDLQQYADDSTISYTQTADIVVNDVVVIDTLNANYNGGNHKITFGNTGAFVIKNNQAEISNLTIVNANAYSEASNATAFVLTNNKILSNINLTTNTIETYASKFGALVVDNTATGVIQGCVVNGTIATFGQLVGGIVASNAGTITALDSEAGKVLTVFTGTVTSSATEDKAPIVGGVAGSNTGKIQYAQSGNNPNNTIILGLCQVGGIAGYSTGEILNCTNYAEVSCNSWGVGGIVGKTENKIDSCNNYGIIRGNNGVAGIAGQSIGGSIEFNSTNNKYEPTKTSYIVNCFNYANITCDSAYEVAGIVGYATASSFSKCGNLASISSSSLAGGIVGKATASTITQCYNKASITTTGNFAGGIAGQLGSDEYGNNSNMNENVEVWDCYNIGAISGSDYVGGIAGRMIRKESNQAVTGGALFRIYNSGSTTGTGANVGRILGYCGTYVRCANAIAGQKFMGVSVVANNIGDDWWSGVNSMGEGHDNNTKEGRQAENMYMDENGRGTDYPNDYVYTRFANDINYSHSSENVWKTVQSDGSGLPVFNWE